VAIIIPAEEPAFYRDSFGKWRVSNPSTLFEAHFIYDEQPMLFDTIEDGSATLTHNSGSYLDLDVTAVASDRVVHQSKRYCNYQPGKSLQFLMTGVLETSGGATGVTCRMGLFDNHADKSVDSGGDGVFFELDDTTLYVVVRSYVSGSQVDTRVAQSAWNGDRLDGSGGATNPSEVTLDISKSQIFAADIEWLSVGSVRFYIFNEGVPILVHTVHNANNIAVPYMRRATLPLRYEISTDGTNAGKMRAICCTVISEGGFNPRGKIYSNDNNTTPISVSGSLIPVFSLKLSDARNRVTINPVGIETVTSSNALYHYEIWIGASLTGASWTSAGTNSAAEYDVSASAITTTGAVRIDSGYFTQTKSGLVTNFENTLLVSSDIAGTSDILSLACIKIGGGSADVYTAVQWQEWE
jgi:hypothetical protein